MAVQVTHIQTHDNFQKISRFLWYQSRNTGGRSTDEHADEWGFWDCSRSDGTFFPVTPSDLSGPQELCWKVLFSWPSCSTILLKCGRTVLGRHICGYSADTCLLTKFVTTHWNMLFLRNVLTHIKSVLNHDNTLVCQIFQAAMHRPAGLNIWNKQKQNHLKCTKLIGSPASCAHLWLMVQIKTSISEIIAYQIYHTDDSERGWSTFCIFRVRL